MTPSRSIVAEAGLPSDGIVNTKFVTEIGLILSKRVIMYIDMTIGTVTIEL